MANLALTGADLLAVAGELGNTFVNLGKPTVGEDNMEHRRFPYPGFGTITYNPGKTSVICRWDGIAFDEPTENERIQVPSGLRFEMRILHPTWATPDIADAYEYAQNKILEGTTNFFSALAKNRSLDGKVMDVGIEGSIVGDLVDPQSGEEFYGHEMVIVTSLFV